MFNKLPLESLVEMIKTKENESYSLLEQLQFIDKIHEIASLQSDYLQTSSFEARAIKHLIGAREELDLIMIGHLYIERIINEVLFKEFFNEETFKKIGIHRFSQKQAFLRAFNKTDEDLDQSIFIINELRNKFAHRLNFSFAQYDFNKHHVVSKYRAAPIIVEVMDDLQCLPIYLKLLVSSLFLAIFHSFSNEYTYIKDILL